MLKGNKAFRISPSSNRLLSSAPTKGAIQIILMEMTVFFSSGVKGALSQIGGRLDLTALGPS